MTQHDPTEEAETLPGIPIAGSDLEKFPSVPPIIGGGGLTLDVSVQQVSASVTTGVAAAPQTVAISAVVLGRAYVILSGSVQAPGSSGTRSWTAIDFSLVWELTNATTISFWRNTTGGSQLLRFHVIEYL